MKHSILNSFTDGYVNVSGYRLYYKIFGNGNTETILCVHGGPGLTHDYILSVADLADFGYKVVFYDQLGCGKSDLPKNLNMFTIERAVQDLEGFRREMKLGKVHMFGSSYGGLLAIAYALHYPANLKSLISAGGIASVPHTIACMEELKTQLPTEVREVMKNYEAAGDYTNPGYMKAVDVFYKAYFCRLPEWPKEVLYSLEHVSLPVYGTMNGPNEFTIVGNIRHWDVTSQLRKIGVPTLITAGKFDEVSPKEARNIHRGIKGSKLVIFQESAHLTMWEEREKYTAVVRGFLTRVGKAKRQGLKEDRDPYPNQAALPGNQATGRSSESSEASHWRRVFLFLWHVKSFKKESVCWNLKNKGRQGDAFTHG